MSILFIHWSQSKAQNASESVQKHTCKFELTTPPSKEPGVTIVGGLAADPSRWPGTLKLETKITHGKKIESKLCTATVVGRNTVLTAAHCLNWRPCTGTLSASNPIIQMRCDPISFEIDRKSNRLDIALCSNIDLRQSIKLIGNARFERLSDKEPTSIIGSTIVILGYGCKDAFGKQKGKLYYGHIKVLEIKDFAYESDATLDPGTMALCSGDSGGGAYDYISENRRRFVGINHQGDDFRKSRILSTNVTLVRNAIRAAAKQGQKICGMNGELGEDERLCSE